MLETLVNAAFAVIAIPIGVGLLGYGIYLSVKGDSDTGLFLILLGVLVGGAVVSGFVSKRKRRPKAAAPPPPPPMPTLPPRPRKRRK